ncbi:acyl-CoA dehydrogenase [Salinibacterium sp. ZJ450]|uniref:acyl-CoA dehydrogenase n=1 Tax=Salinibacterium sp. ZJ450 TaxID=2708338 RepID=UPI00141E60F9|nr:acyl-CoA dehydrogenase [Salinibacterium sp. ZJ450]
MTIAEKARAAAAALAEADADSSRQRHLGDRSWQLVHETGILRAFQPKRWGGDEASITDFADGIVAIGRASASAGWVASVVGVHPWQIALFPDETQQEVWGDNPERAIASSYTPTGSFEKVPGGYRVSGLWSFSSGIDRCDGVILGAVVGEREIDGESHPDFMSAILNLDQYTIDDVWHTAGLQGTGSNNVRVDNAFVPEHRVQSHLLYTKALGTPLPGQELNPAALYRVPWAVLFNLIITAGALGAVHGFLDLWTAETTTRRTNYGTLLRDEAVIQDHLAEAAFTIGGASLRMRRTATELMEIAEAGSVPSEDARAFYRWELAKSAQSATDAVSDLMRSASGRTAYLDHPLHGKFQDVMAASGHAFLASDALGRAYAGRVLGSSKLPAVHL